MRSRLWLKLTVLRYNFRKLKEMAKREANCRRYSAAKGEKTVFFLPLRKFRLIIRLSLKWG